MHRPHGTPGPEARRPTAHHPTERPVQMNFFYWKKEGARHLGSGSEDAIGPRERADGRDASTVLLRIPDEGKTVQASMEPFLRKKSTSYSSPWAARHEWPSDQLSMTDTRCMRK